MEYLKRKVDTELENWLKSPFHSPALITGVRQCGKTRSALQFGKTHFANVNYLNFWTSPDASSIFSGSLNVDDILAQFSFRFPEFKAEPGRTVFIFDEIQDCPRARLSLKNFKEDRRFEVIATGSYIGLNIEDGKNPLPKPSGAEDIIPMKTMDFEEFLWANGISAKQIAYLQNLLQNHQQIPEAVHERMHSLFLSYLVVGGYPESVLKFITDHNYSDCFKKVKSLIFDILGDPAKRRKENGDPLYTGYEIARIQSAFRLIASFNLSQNKRYVVSRINGGNGIQKADALRYLENAGVLCKAHNLSSPSLPFLVHAIAHDFKSFYTDISLLINICGWETVQGLLKGTLGPSKGDIYEAAVADMLYKSGLPLYTFRKPSGLEIDFVTALGGKAVLIEAKAKSGRTKSSREVLSHPERYGPTRLIKFQDSNVGYADGILTIPHYLGFLLGRCDPEKLLPE